MSFSSAVSARVRSRAAYTLGAAVAAAGLIGGATGAFASRAHAARSLNLNDSGRLHLSSKRGIELKEAGTAKGSLSGPIYIQLKLAEGRHAVTAQIQVYPRGGSVKGYASADYRVQTSRTATFSGTLNITGGSGRYAKARGSGLSFSGTVHRPGDDVSVRVNGRMSY